MKTKLILSLVIAAAFVVRAEEAAGEADAGPVYDTWRTLTGQELVAEFVEIRQGMLVLRAEDGKEHSTQLSNMSFESRNLAQLYTKLLPPVPPTSQEIAARVAYENLMDRYHLISAANKDFEVKNEAVRLLVAERRKAIAEEDEEVAELKEAIDENKAELKEKTDVVEAVYAEDEQLAELNEKLAAAKKAEEMVMRQQINIIGARVRERMANAQ